MVLINDLGRIERRLGTFLVVLSFALMATEHLYHYTIGVLALLGLGMWLRMFNRRKSLVVPQADLKLVLTLFLCIYFPMLASLVGAVNPSRALKTTLSYLHFLPAALYICVLCRNIETRNFILAA
ncbi:MAG: hypothetical protein AAF387_19115, partial [Pseudomonadota bacterium]